MAKHFKAGGMPGWPKDAGKVDYVTFDGAKQRDHAKRFPTLAECRAVFDRATGTRNDWPADDDESVTVHTSAA